MFLLADTLMLDQQGKRPPLILDATSFTCQPKVCKIYEKQTKTARQFGMEVCRVGTVILLIFAVLFSRFFLTDIYIFYLKKAPDPLRKRWCICIWIWHNHVSWMSPEVCGTVWDRTFHTVKSDMVKLIKGNDPSKCNLITCFEISYANANFNRLTP